VAFIFFFPRVISELRRPIGAKICTKQFYNRGLKFWGSQIFRGQKHANFGPISVHFKVRRRISPEGMKIFKIGELLDRQRFLQR